MLVLAVLLCFVYASIITDAFMFGVVSPRKRASLFMRPSESELSENAQRALDECNGDVNMATQVIFQRDDAEDDRVRTWNAIAEFLPLDTGSLPSRTTKKLQTIASASFSKAAKSKDQGRLLDVGAGNGQLIPLLKKAGLKVNRAYVGMDISPVMISQLKKKYSVEAHVGDYAEWDSGDEVYQTVLFNGVLQYTEDPLRMITKAAVTSKIIVIAHYQGRKFIREEKESMGDKIKDMPSRDEILAALGPEWTFDEAHSRKETELDDFYLLRVVRKN